MYVLLRRRQASGRKVVISPRWLTANNFRLCSRLSKAETLSDQLKKPILVMTGYGTGAIGIDPNTKSRRPFNSKGNGDCNTRARRDHADPRRLRHTRDGKIGPAIQGRSTFRLASRRFGLRSRHVRQRGGIADLPDKARSVGGANIPTVRQLSRCPIPPRGSISCRTGRDSLWPKADTPVGYFRGSF
jgi:hypothetical protein